MANSATYSARVRDWREEFNEEVATFYFTWEVINQNIANNTSTIKWSSYVEFDEDKPNAELWLNSLRVSTKLSPYLYRDGKVYRDTSVLINEKDWRMQQKHALTDFHRITNVGSGTYTLQHYANGDITNIIDFTSAYFYVDAEDKDSLIYVQKLELQDTTTELDSINRALSLLIAPNFTDEEMPTITYEADTTGDAISQQVALSFDGETAHIPFRSVSANQNTYTFEFTEEDKALIIAQTVNNVHTPIYYLSKTIVNDSFNNNASYTFTSAVERTLTIVGANPSLNPTVKDIKPETLALTGNENIFILNESMIEFTTGAVASKGASIVTQSVQCGSKVVKDLYQGVIDDIESGKFEFNVTDSRGLTTTSVLENFAVINYFKPTCKQEITISLQGETGATISFKASGSYYSGNFGDIDNTFLIEVRYKESNGEFNEWTTLTETPTFKDNTYTISKDYENFNYNSTYIFQCRVTDKLNVVESAQYIVKMLPVFDWGESDFNFNVPVNIEAEALNMHGETIIRHSKSTNNTVLSATGGHIYLRPGGSTSTSGETIIYSNGDIKFGGSVDFSTFSIDGNSLADFVIDSGTEAMGTNGTWYWQKWASGKAEAWGCRNFGRAAITTAWGNLYRSEIFSQELPDDVFITTPDVININLVNITNGAWIVKHEQDAPSAVTTGSFIIVRPASATPTVSYVGFHVIGLWKQ